MTDPGNISPPELDVRQTAHEHLANCREFIGENLEMACFQADMGCRYASVGDDVGLTYALRRLAAHVKAAIRTHADLQASKARGTRS